jgi:hypothetical protein
VNISSPFFAEIVSDSQEEIRDLTIYIEASRKLKNATLLNSGDTITIKEPKIKTGLPLASNPLPRPNSPNNSGKNKKGKGKKKGKK